MIPLIVAGVIGVPLAYLASLLTYNVTEDRGLSLLSLIVTAVVVGTVAAEISYRRERSRR